MRWYSFFTLFPRCDLPLKTKNLALLPQSPRGRFFFPFDSSFLDNKRLPHLKYVTGRGQGAERWPSIMTTNPPRHVSTLKQKYYETECDDASVKQEQQNAKKVKKTRKRAGK
jgi:hypothetical protein